MKILTDRYLKCSGCKQNLEVKTINSSEKEKNEKTMKSIIRILWVIFIINFASMFFNLQALLGITLFFAIEAAIAVGLIIYIVILTKQRRELFEKNEIKLSIIKESSK